ncbi:MAG: N-acetylmuramic acid 6-phosphate etherase, partial [Pseudomonadota bacterium]
AAAVRGGGRLTYVAAGSSGLMALADAAELTGTFGIPQRQIRVCMAGGVPADAVMPGLSEDDVAAASTEVGSLAADDLIIALSASGNTPYTRHIAEGARALGATVIAIANNPDTPLLHCADIPICLQTPPEVLAGSTRLGAGTAQKGALNMISTAAGCMLGHVYHGQMVNVLADNAKLRDRTARMVSSITDRSDGAARAALDQANGQAKPAVLVALGAAPDQAADLLEAHAGHLGPAIASFRGVNV